MTASTFTTVMTTVTKALCLWSLMGTGTALGVVNNLNHQREGRCAVQSPGPCPVARCPPTPPGCSLDEDTLLVNEKGNCCPALCRFVDASGKECRGGDVPASLALYPNPELTEQPRQLGSGIQFEDGLTDSEKAAITRVIEKSRYSELRGSSCLAKTACYASTCWIPFVGIACLACEAVKCDRRLDLATEVPVPHRLGESKLPGAESEEAMKRSSNNCATACQFAGWRTGEVKGTAPFCAASASDCRNRDAVMTNWDAGAGCWSGQKVCCCNA